MPVVLQGNERDSDLCKFSIYQKVEEKRNKMRNKSGNAGDGYFARNAAADIAKFSRCSLWFDFSASSSRNECQRSEVSFISRTDYRQEESKFRPDTAYSVIV